MSLVVVEYELSGSPVGIARRLNEVDTGGMESFGEGIHVINTQVQVQMSALLNKGNGRVGCVHQFQVEATAARSYACVEIRVLEFERESYLFGVEANASIEISRAQLGSDG